MDIQTGQVLRTFGDPGQPIFIVAYTPDGNVVTGSGTGMVVLWNAQTGQEIRRYLGNPGNVIDLVVSHDGKYLFTGDQDGAARLFDVATGEMLRVVNSGFLNTVAISPDEKYLVTAGTDKLAHFWDFDYHDLVQSECSDLGPFRSRRMSGSPADSE